ncbi:MAG TPA: ribbon-helix-helix protein, CopG family [Conexibacter sp.]|nr:ribbon-helix-helix protein, CopG family [Conexibacter sp.]
MKRLQIHIEEELDDALAVAAAQQGTSKAALIREVVAERYGSAADGTEALLSMAGMLKGGSRDDSQSIDDIVYGRP